jgi:hypothetical protein
MRVLRRERGICARLGYTCKAGLPDLELEGIGLAGE